MAFAKLYGTGDNQVLVKIGEVEGYFEVRFHWEYEEAMVSVALVFESHDPEASYQKAKKCFDGIDETKARKTVAQTMKVFLEEANNEI